MKSPATIDGTPLIACTKKRTTPAALPFTSVRYKAVKSPIGITRQLPTSWDWEYVWNFTAMFSIGLAFMNLLPIPGLDGGHALFTIAEMVTGRTLSEKAMGYVQTGGMIFLLSLMALTFGKDIYEIIVDNFFKKV
jgi:regulator of sigma E protease